MLNLCNNIMCDHTLTTQGTWTSAVMMLAEVFTKLYFPFMGKAFLNMWSKVIFSSVTFSLQYHVSKVYKKITCVTMYNNPLSWEPFACEHIYFWQELLPCWWKVGFQYHYLLCTEQNCVYVKSFKVVSLWQLKSILCTFCNTLVVCIELLKRCRKFRCHWILGLNKDSFTSWSDNKTVGIIFWCIMAIPEIFVILQNNLISFLQIPPCHLQLRPILACFLSCSACTDVPECMGFEF